MTLWGLKGDRMATSHRLSGTRITPPMGSRTKDRQISTPPTPSFGYGILYLNLASGWLPPPLPPPSYSRTGQRWSASNSVRRATNIDTNRNSGMIPLTNTGDETRRDETWPTEDQRRRLYTMSTTLICLLQKCTESVSLSVLLLLLSWHRTQSTQMENM